MKSVRCHWGWTAVGTIRNDNRQGGGQGDAAGPYSSPGSGSTFPPLPLFLTHPYTQNGLQHTQITDTKPCTDLYASSQNIHKEGRLVGVPNIPLDHTALGCGSQHAVSMRCNCRQGRTLAVWQAVVEPHGSSGLLQPPPHPFSYWNTFTESTDLLGEALLVQVRSFISFQILKKGDTRSKGEGCLPHTLRLTHSRRHIGMSSEGG
jgi:hypothetical protein